MQRLCAGACSPFWALSQTAMKPVVRPLTCAQHSANKLLCVTPQACSWRERHFGPWQQPVVDNIVLDSSRAACIQPQYHMLPCEGEHDKRG